MNRKLYSAASAAALSVMLMASPAFTQGFSDAAASGLARLGYQAPPVESMSAEQIAQITNILNSQDDDTVKRTRIDLIMGETATATGRLGVAQMRDSAAADMARIGIDTEVVDSLTMSQLGQIENVMAGADSDDTKKMRVEEIIGGEATATGRLGVSQLQDSAAAELAALGVDAEMVESLTVSQLGQIENIMSSSADDSSKRAQVEKILAE
jgi:hypothetical protein